MPRKSVQSSEMVSEKRSHCQDPEPSDGGFVAEALFSGNGVGQLMPVRRGLRQALEVRGEKILAAAMESILASQGLEVGTDPQSVHRMMLPKFSWAARPLLTAAILVAEMPGDEVPSLMEN
ncbi:hypothetical protein AnigIFM60653_000691 [Aspergillus niger]|nr:hypothetical protein AnigIFM60653_000691 [Aspergillus niger]GLA17071.1 hypothetical protein AnigIFM62618_004186 [Aspergillus niger]